MENARRNVVLAVLKIKLFVLFCSMFKPWNVTFFKGIAEFRKELLELVAHNNTYGAPKLVLLGLSFSSSNVFFCDCRLVMNWASKG